MNNLFLIKKPWITEKGTMLNGMGKYVFLVQSNATKNEVKKLVHELYKVDVADVNIVNRPGKPRGGPRSKGLQPGIKKAIVTLKAGQTIALQ